jgi:hypothetical protein
LSIWRNLEQAEKQEHPLNRIMTIEREEPDTLVITTTDVHLPRRIGTAIHHAFHGDLNCTSTRTIISFASIGHDRHSGNLSACRLQARQRQGARAAVDRVEKRPHDQQHARVRGRLVLTLT